MPRSKPRALLCLATLSCLPVFGRGLRAGAFLTTAPSQSVSSSFTARTSASAVTALPTAAATAMATALAAATDDSYTLETKLVTRSLRRPRARDMSREMFPSVARTPLPPGYEGERKERENNDDERDFNLNVGKVIDTLKRDYPRIFEEPLDFDIYAPDLQLRDPTGVVLTGLPAYQRLFATFRFFRQVLVHDVSTVFRLSYDGSRQQVRVTWHFILDATPVISRPMHVDGTSVYSLNAKGLVRRHDIETVIFNGTPIKPPFSKAWMNIPSWVSKGLAGRRAAPGLTSLRDGFMEGSRSAALIASAARVLGAGSLGTFEDDPTSKGRLSPAVAGLQGPSGSQELVKRIELHEGVFRASSEGLGEGGDGGEVGAGAGAGIDDSKSKSKKDDRGDEDSKDTKPPTDKKKPKKKKKGFWPIEIDGPLGCETSWDCTGGYVCCDLLVVKICCSNGIMQPKPGDLIPALTPIPGRGRTELDQ